MRVMIAVLWLTLTFLSISAQRVVDEGLIESYVARLSPQDHFNSRGDRLTTPALVIRQDRANFHEYGKADNEDQSDKYFADKTNRETLQKMLEKGQTTRSVYDTIVNNYPLIRVNVYRSAQGYDYATVVILKK